MLPGVLRQNALSRAPPDPDEQKEFSDDTESALVASQTSLERFEKGFVAAVNLLKLFIGHKVSATQQRVHERMAI